MKLLLDTHTFLWFLTADKKLGPRARAALEAADNFVFVSAASAWEIAIKQRQGRLDTKGDMPTWLGATGFRPLAIEVDHATASAALPLHHNDPFDRILIAQAILENMRLVAQDDQIEKYDVELLPASS